MKRDGVLAIIFVVLAIALFTVSTRYSSDTTCAGVQVAAGASIQAAINSRPSGTHFCLAAGTYKPAGLVAPKASDVIEGRPGTIVDGRSVVVNGFGGSARGVTVQDLTVQNYTNYGIDAAVNWHVSGVTSTRNGTGVRMDDGVSVDGSILTRNKTYGFSSYGMSNLSVTGTEVAYNNTDPSLLGGGADTLGGVAGTADGITISRDDFHDNAGQGGYHCDTDCTNVVVSDSTFTNNAGPGILIERDWSGTVTGNTVVGNDGDKAGLSCAYGSQIHLNTSSNIEVSNNTVDANVANTNGICVYDANRGTGPNGTYTTRDNYVHDNTVTETAGGDTGLVGTYHHATTLNNRFDSNHYHVADSVTAPHFAWPGVTPRTWTQWRALGMDTTGDIASP